MAVEFFLISFLMIFFHNSFDKGFCLCFDFLFPDIPDGRIAKLFDHFFKNEMGSFLQQIRGVHQPVMDQPALLFPKAGFR